MKEKIFQRIGRYSLIFYNSNHTEGKTLRECKDPQRAGVKRIITLEDVKRI